MESGAELPAEIHPLKAEEGPTEKKTLGGTPRTPGRLSRWRTAAFFLALFLCLAAVFAFSFIIPCPVRTLSQRAWNRTYSSAVAYRFLATRDVDQDGVKDVLFAYRASSDRDNSSSLNTSCAEAGFAPPCTFLAALSGTDGRTLWEKPVAEELLQVDCSMECGRSPGCLLVGRPGSVTALDLHTGQSLWKQTANWGASAVVLWPLLQVPDIDADGVPDFLLFTALGQEVAPGAGAVVCWGGESEGYREDESGSPFPQPLCGLLEASRAAGGGGRVSRSCLSLQIKTWFFSGKHGTQIGSPGSLSLPGWVGHLQQVTKTGAHYVLFCTAGALYGYSVKELHHKATGTASDSLTEDPQWALAIDGTSHRVPLLSSGDIQYLEKMPGKSGTDIVVVRSASLELLDGQHLGSLWTSSTPHALSKPVFGFYHSGTMDVVLESRVAPDRKKVLILRGSSAAVDWETELPWAAGSPQAATLATVDHRSLFFFWAAVNTTLQHLHAFHPSLPTVLLETSSVREPIVAFQAALLERSRHACCLLLTGPRAGELAGQVVLSKRKLKDALADGRVVWLNQAVQDSEQHVRDHFLRMRFRSLG
ncbi:hypothetical protein lerEdw1_004512 [Lerista edwardsae]|nr:hypothetical protein lerEdw1_004512 [Lerista edwardsae]